MSAHTPGPWVVAPGGIASSLANPGNYNDCSIVMRADDVGGDVAWIPENGQRKSNAQLIAAAPELLILVRRFIDAARWDGWGEDDELMTAARLMVWRLSRGAP